MSLAGAPAHHSTVRLVAYSLLSGIAAALFALIDLCGRVMAPGQSGAGQSIGALGSGESPVITALWWSPSMVRLVSTVAGMEPGVRLIVYVALVCVPAYCLVSGANPTFRITTGVDWDRTILVRTYMHTAPLIKVFLVCMAALVPVYVLWIASYALLPGAVASAVAAGATGAAALLALARAGIAGDLESGNYLMPTGRRLVISLASRGAAAGLLLWLGVALATHGAGQQVADCLAVAGGGGQGLFLQMAGVLASWIVLVVGTCVGAALTSVTPGIGVRTRMIGLAPSTAIVLALAYLSGATPWLLRSRLDYAPRVPQGMAVAAIMGPNDVGAQAESGVILGPEPATVVSVARSTTAGLVISPRQAASLEHHLKRRGYRTVLAADILQSLFETYVGTHDRAAAMRTIIAGIRYAPDPAWSGLFYEALATWATTPSARDAAREAVRRGLFVMPTRMAWLELGDTMAATGDAETTRYCYNQAGVQRSRIEDRLRERLRFVSGSISGSIRLDHRPLAHVRVSAISAAAFGDQAAGTGVPGLMAPVWLRHIAADTLTDAQGRYRIGPIAEGEYRLIVWGAVPKASPLTRIRTTGYLGDNVAIEVTRSAPERVAGDVELVGPEPRSGAGPSGRR